MFITATDKRRHKTLLSHQTRSRAANWVVRLSVLGAVGLWIANELFHPVVPELELPGPANYRTSQPSMVAPSYRRQFWTPPSIPDNIRIRVTATSDTTALLSELHAMTQRGRWDEALALALRAHRRSDMDPRFSHYLIDACLHTERWSHARQYIGESLLSHPRDISLLMKWALVDAATGDIEGATQRLAALPAATQDQRFELMMAMADAHLFAGDRISAILVLRLVHERFPAEHAFLARLSALEHALP